MNMLRRLPATLWSLILVSLLGLPLLTPLFRWTAVACTHDGHLHYHRVAAMRHAWENGLAFSRWLPDLAFGYGYPFFVYREPLPLYLVLGPHLLGLPLPAAENLFYGLCLLAAGWFMFLWVRDLFGARAGIVSAVAYMSAPYLLIDALVRGNSPESLALPLMPFVLWVSRRWLLSGRIRFFLATLAGLAVFSLSHNISLLIFTPTLVVYLAALAYLHKVKWRLATARIILGLGLGLGVTLFYPAGALLEMGSVTLQQSTTTRNNDFHYNFATLAEIFSPVRPEDPTLLNPPLFFRLGWVILGLALLGLLCWFWYRRLRRQAVVVDPARDLQLKEQQWHLGLMALATAVYLFMSLSASLLIWENLPLIDFVQFPWRLVGRAALPLALLAGVPFTCLPEGQPLLNKRFSRVLFFLAVPLLILEALPYLYPNVCEEDPFPTIMTVFQYEHETGLVGVDPEGSYFPNTVRRRPKDSPLEADYAAGNWPQRFATQDLPTGAEVETALYHPLAATIQVSSPEPFTATYLAFAFPGWRVQVDGRPVTITPSDPEGFITFELPAGSHTVSVRWGSTPLRSGLVLLSLLAFAAVLAVVIFGRRLAVIDHKSLPAPVDCLRASDYWLLLAAALLLLLFKLLVVDQFDTPWHRPAAPPVTQTAQLQGGTLQLEGFRLSQRTVASGGTVDIDLAWTAVDYPQTQYQSNVWLVDAAGQTWSAKETFRPRLYEDAPPTIAWQPGQWAWDSREIQLLAGTPPGRYNMVLTLFDLATLQPFTLQQADGSVLGPTAVIGQIEVTAADRPPIFAPQFPADTPLPDYELRLVGTNQDRQEATPGDPFLLTLFWEYLGTTPSQTIPLTLLDETGATLADWFVTVPAAESGAGLRTQTGLRLPAALNDGRYHFNLANNVTVATIEVEAPDRVFTAPAMETTVATTFYLDGTPLATLAGLNLTTPAQPLELIWQATNEFPASYRVFIHLLDDTGTIIAQSDGEPAGWTRPTTGWANGEYIVDRHQLTVPESPSSPPTTLRIGLYDPAGGNRLQTDIGTTTVDIPLP